MKRQTKKLKLRRKENGMNRQLIERKMTSGREGRVAKEGGNILLSR